MWKDNSHLLFHKCDGTHAWISPVDKFLAGLGLPYQAVPKSPTPKISDFVFCSAAVSPVTKAYNGAGGHATMIEVGVWKDNSHLLFHKYDGTHAWISPVDKFLAGLGLPYQAVPKSPTSSRSLDVEDVFALSEIVHQKQSIVEGYEHYLCHSPPKAFAVSPDRHYGSATGENAQTDAINLRASHTKATCLIYAIDAKVTYTKSGP